MILWIVFALTWAAWAKPAYLHQNERLCAALLADGSALRLTDLIQSGLIEPDGEYLHSPRDAVEDHEYVTAEILASRLKRTTVLVNRLGRIAVPSVDGIMFDERGVPTHNFSLKTFVPDNFTTRDSNTRLARVLDSALDDVRYGYRHSRWEKIFARTFAGLPEAVRERETRLFFRIFGVGPNIKRPLLLAIDYSRDPDAVFRLEATVNREGRTETRITLNDADEETLSLDAIQAYLAEDPTIKELILIGRHNIMNVHPKGYRFTEVRDPYGH